MHARYLKFFALAAIAAALSACASSKFDYTETINIDAYPGPNIQGINRYLPENTTGSRLHGGIIAGKTDYIKLENVENRGDWDSLDIDAKYKIIYLPVYGSIDKFAKGDLFTMSLGFGICHGVYASTGVGINTKHFELGLTSFQRFTYQTFNYFGYEKQENGTLDTLEDWTNNAKIVFQYGAGAYASLFLGPVSLSYNGNIYRPNKSIVFTDPNPEFNFATPYLFTNNFLVSYWYSETTEFQIGLTNILIDSNGGNWSLTAGISLWSF